MSFNVTPQIYADPETDTYSELLGSFQYKKTESSVFSKDKLLRTIDDVLLLAAFATRRKTVCLKWTYRENRLEVTEHLRDRAVPNKVSKRQMKPEKLIEITDFPEFMKTAYSSLRNYKMLDEFRRALHFISPTDAGTYECDFISLYSALEMLVLHFRLNNDFDEIFPPEKFKDLKKDISNFIKQQDLSSFLENEIVDEIERKKVLTTKRKLIYEKLGELNRVSFGSAYKKFCSDYQLDLSDLWPVTGSKGDSLSEIRNKLVHGVYFGREHTDGQIYAGVHLRWIMERMVLGILKWPISKSKVSPGYLGFLNPYRAWEVEIGKFRN